MIKAKYEAGGVEYLAELEDGYVTIFVRTVLGQHAQVSRTRWHNGNKVFLAVPEGVSIKVAYFLECELGRAIKEGGDVD